MTTDLDGTLIDLDRVQTALDGSQWLWTCELTESGQPVMARLDGPCIAALADVYANHGPLIASPEPPTAAMCRKALEAAS